MIILSDLRAVPLIAALKIARENRDSILLASKRLFYNREYADYTPLVWKLLLMVFLKIFCNVKIIAKDESTCLDDSETMGLTSSLYSITNDSGATKTTYPGIYNEVKELALGSKEVVNYISSFGASLVYLFNGRTASSYLVSKHCHNLGIEVAYYEYAGHCNGYRLYPVPPHASGDIGRIIMKFRDEAVISIPELRRNAIRFRKAKLDNEYSVNNRGTSKKEYDVSIYLGSDHEYTAVDPAICNISWQGNIAFCRNVLAKYGVEKSYAIRCHPNSYHDKNWLVHFEELQEFVSSTKADIDLFGPDSKVDSHDLMRKSSRVVTELSSIAVDAVLMGLEVDIFGNTDLRVILQNLDCRSNWTQEEKSIYIAEVFSLWPRFLVVRFNRKEKLACRALFYVHRFFDKIAQDDIHAWKRSAKAYAKNLIKAKLSSFGNS